MTSTAAYDYELPQEAIAQVPADPRPAARLLDALGPSVVHRRVWDLPALLGPGDVVVVNDTRVLPARLHLRKATGGAAEVLLLEERDDGTWEALVRPGRRLPPGTALFDDRGVRAAEVGEPLGEDGRRAVRLLVEPAAVGQVALPPYITTPLDDPERYQTVYARRPASVAAPTAGLHLTSEVLDACRAAGAAIHPVELVVGLGTFRPMTTERVEDHVMHTERYVVPPETMDAVEGAARVVAVGTTAVRALESAAATGRLDGRTGLFIRPGFEFRAVDALLTNFHLPRSSLLVLLAAFCGERWRGLYATALDAGYRFLSFGDAMIVNRAGGTARP